MKHRRGAARLTPATRTMPRNKDDTRESCRPSLPRRALCQSHEAGKRIVRQGTRPLTQPRRLNAPARIGSLNI